MPSIRLSEGRRLSWEEVGRGLPLLCHPGGPGSSSRCFGGLPDLARARTLLLLDPRGTGDSDRPADPHAYDLADYAADVEAMREHLDVDRLDVLGHSHGGFVAITWASSHPEYVGRLVLASTAAWFTPEIRSARQALVASYSGEPWFANAVAGLEDHQAGRYGDDAEFATLLERELPFYFPRWDEEDQAVAGRLHDGWKNSDALRHFNEHIAAEMDLRPVLARIVAPTLVITGERDFFGESTAHELADALPNATAVVLPDAGHFVFGEARSLQVWTRAILDFLSSESV